MPVVLLIGITPNQLSSANRTVYSEAKPVVTDRLENETRCYEAFRMTFPPAGLE